MPFVHKGAEGVSVMKQPGDAVAAGSIVAEAALTIRVARPLDDNTVARIRRLAEKAEAARSPTQRLVDCFSWVYMPVVVGLAALTMVAPPLLFGAAWETWV